MKKKSVLLLAFGFLLNSNVNARLKADPIILTIAGENISKSEFERVFKKNNNKESVLDKKAINDYINLYVNYKLKVKEAIELRMDTVKSFVDELAGYRKQLAQPYLVDKDVTENLVKEAYNRMKKDIRASHILFKLTADALPSDTLGAYNKAVKIRQEILKGADFATVAKEKSDDPSAKENGGDLGYFTSMQMVYAFETAAYHTEVGEISEPVLTKFGYHIIKITDSRPAPGEVKVAHIMIKSTNGMKEEGGIAVVDKINEIYNKLLQGESFEELAKKFSEDQGSAKSGGALPMFGTGRMVPDFEKVAFELKNIGDYSKPVHSPYGWHIIKLLEKKPLGTFEELQNELKSKIGKDSRSELSKTSMIARIKKKYNFKEIPKAKDEFMRTVDSSLTEGKWAVDRASRLKNNLFSFANKNYSQKDFAVYLSDHQSRKSGVAPQSIANNMYIDWINEIVIAYEESNLDSLYSDFRNLMQEYRDGILLFELTDKKVWSKAVKDTTGLKEYFTQNHEKYKWSNRMDASIYTCANAEVAKVLRKQMKKTMEEDSLLTTINKLSKLNLQVKSSRFTKGENEIIDSIPWVVGVTGDIKKNDQVILVHVKKLLPSQQKTMDEAKGIITADYQSFLEKEWISSLRQKYPVRINQEVVDTITN